MSKIWDRFDSARLRPVPAQAVSARSCGRSVAIVSACRTGAGPATRPPWQLWGVPRIECPFGIFHVDDAEAARRACLALDGSWAMSAAPSAAARHAIRLRAKLVDAAWWRPLHDDDAWDTGVAIDAAALAGFVPRRASLIVIDGMPDKAGRRALAALEARSQALRRALRVLVVSAGPVPSFARAISA